ncbi:hypothetical protein ACEWY4_002984 [Coilia grayii]|uniref:Uncharacterized protein n=1 Tax=Coilia grayii TaxID=363190 RepID=A0ABD1KR30_9TELE
MLFRVVLGPDNIRRLTVNEALDSVHQLKGILRESLQLTQDFEIQFEDPEFANELCNLSDISELPPEKATLKIINKAPELSDDVSSVSSLDTASVASSQSPTSYPSPSSMPLRRHENSEQWPSPFPIPQFSYDVELRLVKGNEVYRQNGTLLDVSREMKSNILNAICKSVFSYKAYPTKNELALVAAELVKKHPCLKDPSMGTCYDSWTMSLFYKVGNYRHKLKEAGCSEVSVNRRTPGKDGGKRLKRAKRCEVNFLPDIPAGQCQASLQLEKAALMEEMKKRHHNSTFISAKMEMTFSLRRKEIVDEEPLVADVLTQWPALFLEEQVYLEFYRITGVPLKDTFFSSLDEYAPKIIKLYRSRSGAFGEDLKSLLDKLDQKTTNVVLHRKTTALQGLPVFMRENTNSLFKSCLQPGTQMGILSVIEDDGATADTVNGNVRCFSVIIEEHIVVDDLPDLPTALALLFGLIYALNLKYPDELKYTFETLQKVFMHLDTNLSARVLSFRNKMLRM